MDGRRVVLGVGGGIAAYKVADLLRKLTEVGHDVTVGEPWSEGRLCAVARDPADRFRDMAEFCGRWP